MKRGYSMEHRRRSNGASIHFSRPKKRIQSAEGIGGNLKNKEIKLQETPLFFPAGFEKIFLAVYFVSLPYILGLIFLFFYIAEGDFNIFVAINKDSPFLMTWAIGYEILATMIILWIIKNTIAFTRNNSRRKSLKKFIN